MQTDRELSRERELATLSADMRALGERVAMQIELMRAEVRAGNLESSRRFDGIDERLDAGERRFGLIDAEMEAAKQAKSREDVSRARNAGEMSAYRKLGIRALAIFGSVAAGVGYIVAHNWPSLAAWIDPPPPGSHH